MSMHAFSGETTPSLVNLDANFTELYQLRNLFTVSGTLLGLGGTPTQNLSVFGGNIGMDASNRKIGYLDGDAVHQGYILPYSTTGTTEVHNTFGTGNFSVFTGPSDTLALRVNASGDALVGRSSKASGGKLEVSGNVVLQPAAAAPTLGTNGDMSFQLVSNTSLKILVRGSDGVTRSATLTLA